MNNKLEDLGKSYELAAILESIKPMLQTIDLEFARKAGEGMVDQGNFQDSAAVLNPSYDPTKSDLLRLQGETLLKLVEFVESLKEIDELKEQVRVNQNNMAAIQKMFL